MRRIAIVFVATLVVSVGVAQLSAKPTGRPRLNWGAQVNRSQCPDGKLVINVTQKIINSVDSGVAGNNWAFDDYNRQIQVVEVSLGTYCATVKYEGKFTTAAGISPGGTGTVPDGLRGTFQGGYVTTDFTATLKSATLARTNGNIGTFNYQCDISGNCPGASFWGGLYFDNITGFDLAWWGWVYHAGRNGGWVNSIDGNSGDITG